ncbi:MAG: hypothetical protein CVV59_00965 [Tenericutes bacterium HGW-Tenericutes-4]|nr:MAG: hypothetical protein CVV59_00965 [Tenericutes bacterium HGW-Tenericutes-4]
MSIFIIRSIITYFILFFILRIMGKRQVGELQPFELVITLMLAELAILPMQETGLSLVNGIVPLLTLVTIHFLLSFLSRKSIFARKIVCGNPVIVINPDGIQFKKLKDLNMNINELQEALRGAGYFTFKEVAYAIIETNGKLSVLPKSMYRPTTPADFNKTVEPSSIDMTLMIDGTLLKNNMKQCNVSEKFVVQYLKKAGIKRKKDCLLVSINNNGLLYIQPKYAPYKTYEVSYKGGVLK